VKMIIILNASTEKKENHPNVEEEIKQKEKK
jgi:hypothetical protein